MSFFYSFLLPKLTLTLIPKCFLLVCAFCQIFPNNSQIFSRFLKKNILRYFHVFHFSSVLCSFRSCLLTLAPFFPPVEQESKSKKRRKSTLVLQLRDFWKIPNLNFCPKAKVYFSKLLRAFTRKQWLFSFPTHLFFAHVLTFQLDWKIWKDPPKLAVTRTRKLIFLKMSKYTDVDFLCRDYGNSQLHLKQMGVLFLCFQKRWPNISAVVCCGYIPAQSVVCGRDLMWKGFFHSFSVQTQKSGNLVRTGCLLSTPKSRVQLTKLRKDRGKFYCFSEIAFQSFLLGYFFRWNVCFIGGGWHKSNSGFSVSFYLWPKKKLFGLLPVALTVVQKWWFCSSEPFYLSCEQKKVLFDINVKFLSNDVRGKGSLFLISKIPVENC